MLQSREFLEFRDKVLVWQAMQRSTCPGLTQERAQHLHLIEDGHSGHTGDEAEAFKASASDWLRPLPHPANSPDLQPIEHVWFFFKGKLKYQPVPQSVAQAMETCGYVWLHVMDWPKVIKVIIKAHRSNAKAVRELRGGNRYKEWRRSAESQPLPGVAQAPQGLI